ncbi:MAG: PilZ domain-containing protein [Rhodoferax sp.]
MSQDDSTAPAAANTDVSRLPLKALGLRTGMALQTRRLVEGASKREAQFYGAIEGKGVMVGPLGPEGVKTELLDGEVCVVRGFTGQYEFSFLSKVLQTFQKPFVYALLAYPAKVDATLVRQSMRTKTSWPSTVRIPPKDGAADAGPQEATLVDISLQGAMIKLDSPLATVGEIVTLGIAVTFDNAPLQLNLSASICHNNRGANDTAYYIGLAFKDVTQHDKLVLHYVTQAPQAAPGR